MDRSDIIYLLTPTKIRTTEGVIKEWYTEKLVYCQVRSVSKSEFFEGGRSGLNPQFEFDVFSGDYDGQTVVKYRGATYAVYRTYERRDDIVELYVQREGGTNGKESYIGEPVTTS